MKRYEGVWKIALYFAEFVKYKAILVYNLDKYMLFQAVDILSF
jgi:hypothetical protein